MMDNSLKPVVAKLEDLFKLFNEKYYNGELMTPVITVSPDITAGAYGWCTIWKAWRKANTKDDEDGYYEINMCAEHLTRPLVDVCGTLLHEMVHLWCLQNDIKDTSRGTSYHNKKFKAEAEQRGLIIDKHEKYGWTITSLNEECREYIESMNIEGFGIHRTKMVKAEKGKTSKKSSSRKYVCPDCGVIVRATKDVRIICAECDTELELEE